MTSKNSVATKGGAPIWVRALFWASLVGLWWLLAARKIWPPYLLPSPVAVLIFLRDSITDGSLFPAILTSMLRLFVGFSIAAAFGAALGTLLARVRWLDDTVGVAALGLQSLPSICWFPLALIWFGLTESAVLFVVVAGALFAVTLAVRAGIRALPPLTARVGKVYGAKGVALWWHVLLPASLPAILSGLRQGWAFAWRSLMAAELLSQSLRAGVGHLLNNGRDFNDMTAVFGMIGVILGVGLVSDRILFFPMERFIARRWGVDGA